MCPSLKNPDLVFKKTGYSQSPTHSRPVECGSRQAIQARPDHLNRVVSSSRGLSVNMQLVHQTQIDLFAKRFNSKLTQLVSPVLDPLALAVDALSLPWEDLDPYAFPPVAILCKVVAKLQDYPHRRIILIAQHALVMGPSDYVDPDSLVPAQPADAALQSDSSQESVKPTSWLGA